MLCFLESSLQENLKHNNPECVKEPFCHTAHFTGPLTQESKYFPPYKNAFNVLDLFLQRQEIPVFEYGKRVILHNTKNGLGVGTQAGRGRAGGVSFPIFPYFPATPPGQVMRWTCEA